MMKPDIGLLNTEEMILFGAYYAYTSGRVNLDTDFNKRVTQAYFFRKIPKYLGTYVLFVGLEQVIGYLQAMKKDASLTPDMIKWFERTSGGDMTPEFIHYLETFDPDFNVWAVPEGTPMFPNEPSLIIEGKANDIQIIEDGLLTVLNHQSLIATKASRIRFAAGKRSFVDFGARRAHGWLAGFHGARASYIGGTDGTSLVLAGYRFGIPYIGTIPHAFIQLRQHPDKTFNDSELESLIQYANTYPHNTVLLVDTYNSISGVMNAIAVGRMLRKKGHELKGIRLDSGDIVKLSKLARQMLNGAGMQSARIYVSNNMDEYEITKLLGQGAFIDGFGVGTRLQTGANCSHTGYGGTSALGGVLKVIAIEDEPNMKFTDSKSKQTLPGMQQVWRTFDPRGQYKGDFIATAEENLKSDFAKPLLTTIMKKGELIYDFPETKAIRKYSMSELDKFPRGIRRIIMRANVGPPFYSVRLSPGLEKLKKELVLRYTNEYTSQKSTEETTAEKVDKFMEVIDERNKIQERLKWEIDSEWGSWKVE